MTEGQIDAAYDRVSRLRQASLDLCDAAHTALSYLRDGNLDADEWRQILQEKQAEVDVLMEAIDDVRRLGGI